MARQKTEIHREGREGKERGSEEWEWVLQDGCCEAKRENEGREWVLKGHGDMKE